MLSSDLFIASMLASARATAAAARLTTPSCWEMLWLSGPSCERSETICDSTCLYAAICAPTSPTPAVRMVSMLAALCAAAFMASSCAKLPRSPATAALIALTLPCTDFDVPMNFFPMTSMPALTLSTRDGECRWKGFIKLKSFLIPFIAEAIILQTASRGALMTFGSRFQTEAMPLTTLFQRLTMGCSPWRTPSGRFWK